MSRSARRFLLMFGGGGISPVLRGIEGLWLFDEGEGVTAADSSGNSHDANLGADAYTPSWVTEGLSCDIDFLDILGWAPNLSSGYTLQCSFLYVAGAETKPGFFSTRDGANRAAVRTDANAAAEVWLSPAANELVVRHNLKDGSDTLTQAKTYANSLWHLMAFVQDGTNGRFYVDGVAADVAEQLDAVSSSVANTVLLMGRANDLWSGKIGIIKLNSVVLTDAELTQDADYIKSVMAGRGVTLPFEPGDVPNTLIACLYDEGITHEVGENDVSEWTGVKGRLVPAAANINAQVLPASDGIAGHVAGALYGLETDPLSISQPFTFYALVCGQEGAFAFNNLNPIAFFDHASEDVSFHVNPSAIDSKAWMTSGGTAASPDSSVDGGVFPQREWQRVRAVSNGASSTVQFESTTVNGTLDDNGISGVLQTLKNGMMVAHWQLINGVVSAADHDQMWGYLDTIKAQLPTYSSVIVQPIASGEYRGLGNCAVYDTDKLVAVYYFGGAHQTADSDARITTSADGGDTWAEESVIHTVPEGYFQRGVKIAVLDSDRWVVSWCEKNTDMSNIKSYTMYSDNEGGAWSSPAEVPAPGSVTVWGIACGSQVKELSPGGDLILTCWGVATADGERIIPVYRSEDSGASWSLDSTVSIANVSVDEADMQVLASGSILMLIRQNSGPMYRTTANPAADPLVWSTPTTLFRAEAWPGFCQLSNDMLVLCTRDFADYYDATARNPMCIYTSDDDGLTWDGPIHPEPWSKAQMYGQPVEYDGFPYVFWSEESTGAALHWRDLSDVIS